MYKGFYKDLGSPRKLLMNTVNFFISAFYGITTVFWGIGDHLPNTCSSAQLQWNIGQSLTRVTG